MIKLIGYAVAAAVVLGLVLCVPFAVIWMINVFGDRLMLNLILRVKCA